MDSANLSAEQGKAPSELENLQKQHAEKVLRIQELKKQIQEVRQQLVSDRKEGVCQEKVDAFKEHSTEYNCLRQEYNTLSAGKSRGSEE